MTTPGNLRRVDDTIWELPRSHRKGMRVPARIYGTEKLIRAMDDTVFEQVANVATLPGITDYAFCMPDGHWGYGFPIGGVAAMDPEDGGDLPRRHRLRHQLRHAPGAHQPDEAGGRAPPQAARGPALRSGTGGRRQERAPEGLAAGVPRRSWSRAHPGACARAWAGRRTWS